MRKKAESKNIITAAEAAKLLAIPVSTFYHLSKKGVIKGIKIGGRWRYKLADIQHYRIYGCNKNLAHSSDLISLPPHETAPSSKTLRHLLSELCGILKNVDISKFVYPENDEEDERRKHCRINTKLPSKIIFPLEEPEFNGSIYNLSAGGLCLGASSLNGTSVGDPITLKFMLGSPRAALLSVDGRVVYVSGNRIGVKFRYLNDKTKEEIKRYVG